MKSYAQIYTEAAEIIDSGSEEFACLVIDDLCAVAGCYHYAAREYFESLFDPGYTVPGEGGWWLIDDKKEKQARILALLFAAEIRKGARR